MQLTRAQVREIDRRAIEEFGVPSLVLMENAGRGAAEWLVSLGVGGSVAICCGKGNNGGDGLVMARHLDNRGIAVHVHLFARPDQLSMDAAVQWRIVQASRLPCTTWTDALLDYDRLTKSLRNNGWLVDALFGTGLQGPLKPPFDGVVASMNASGVPIFAVDIPSGLDADTGQPLGATICASHTATFVASKQGFGNPAAAAWLGTVQVIDIGAPTRLLADYR